MKNTSGLAPIVLFVYNRPHHARQTLEALLKNPEAKESILYVYADGPKEGASPEVIDKIREMRKLAREISGFKEVHVVEAEKNLGLANSVIKGTTEIVNKYGRVITLEDDVIVTRSFLEYVNKGLELYKNRGEVMMISGYNFPFDTDRETSSAYFLPIIATQAWGTWKRAWDHFDLKAYGYEKLKTSTSLRKAFNFNNSFDYTASLLLQMESSKIDSWAIRWWWTVFNKKGLVLFPDRSLIQNIGWDGSGRHCDTENPFEVSNWSAEYRIDDFPHILQSNRQKEVLLQSYFRNLFSVKGVNKKASLYTRLKNLVKKNLNRMV